MFSKTRSGQEFALAGAAATIYPLYILLSDPLTMHTFEQITLQNQSILLLPSGSKRYGCYSI